MTKITYIMPHAFIILLFWIATKSCRLLAMTIPLPLLRDLMKSSRSNPQKTMQNLMTLCIPSTPKIKWIATNRKAILAMTAKLYGLPRFCYAQSRNDKKGCHFHISNFYATILPFITKSQIAHLLRI